MIKDGILQVNSSYSSYFKLMEKYADKKVGIKKLQSDGIHSVKYAELIRESCE